MDWLMDTKDTLNHLQNSSFTLHTQLSQQLTPVYVICPEKTPEIGLYRYNKFLSLIIELL